MPLLLIAFLALSRLQAAVPAAEWPAYGGDGAGTRYSPLRQINRDNVQNLKTAWTLQTGDAAVTNSAAKNAAFEATPIMIEGALYLSTPFNRVLCLDPRSGAVRWRFDPKVDMARRYSEVTSRGVSTWKAGGKPRRIFLGTLDARLIALDAATGEPCRDFGKNGEVDLSPGPVEAGQYQVTSPPAILGDLVIIGSSIGDNRRARLESGVVRAYDAVSGHLRWSWNPIPPSTNTGAANAWSVISVDPANQLIFVPTSSPSPDYYGGQRPGGNRHANSVAALRAPTGELVWSFQVVHHDLWDYDVAAQPTLITLNRDGQSLPAVVIGTKMGHVFVLHRETGEPLFPIEERPVPVSDIPGEQASRTQVFPVLPPPLVPQKLDPEEAWGPTPQDCDWCKEKLKELRNEGLFTPPSLKGTVVYPSSIGGLHWGGMAFDPESQFLFANVNNIASVVRLIPRADYEAARASTGHRISGEFAGQLDTPYAMYREFILSPSGTPCSPPPWGSLVAVNLATGTIAWKTPLGFIPRFSQFTNSTRWGSVNLGGAIVTAGSLVFTAASMDTHLRAFDSHTGQELWKTELPASAQATPMTYEAGGRQYLLIAAGGHGKLGTKMGDHVVAFALE